MKSTSKAQFGVCLLAGLGAPSTALAAPCDVPPATVEQISPDGISYIDPEFHGLTHLMVFQDSSRNMYLSELDPCTGHFLSANGFDVLVDTNIAPGFVSKNGPEFGGSSEGTAIYYTKAGSGGVNQVWRSAFVQDSLEWEFEPPEQLTRGIRDNRAALSSIDYDVDHVTVFTVRGNWRDGDLIWFDADQPIGIRGVIVESRPARTNASMLPSTDWFVTSTDQIPRDLHIINRYSGEVIPITELANDTYGAQAWRAPEYDYESTVVAVIENVGLGVWHSDNITDPSSWVHSTTVDTSSLSSLRLVLSAEPMVVNGESYISFSMQNYARDEGEIWVYSLSTGETERCDDGAPNTNRTEPEPVVMRDRLHVYYSLVEQDAWEVWRCSPSIAEPLQ